MSVNQTENKRKGIHQIGYCLKYLMTFLSPYKGGLILGHGFSVQAAYAKIRRHL